MEAAICSEILLTLNTVSNYLSEFRGLHCGLNYDLPSWHHVICYEEITFLKKTHYVHLQGRSYFYPEDGGTKFPRSTKQPPTRKHIGINRKAATESDKHYLYLQLKMAVLYHKRRLFTGESHVRCQGNTMLFFKKKIGRELSPSSLVFHCQWSYHQCFIVVIYYPRLGKFAIRDCSSSPTQPRPSTNTRKIGCRQLNLEMLFGAS